MSITIAAWSGPRNISTAMMRAWENRGDCAVSDEPLYAHYLQATGLDHPGAAKVIAAGDTDARRVIAHLTGPVPEGRPLWYQKHMSHHMLPGMPTLWLRGLTNVFLIRDPALVVASYVKSRATVAAEDIGLLQQQVLFDDVAQALGHAPPVIDTERFLADPRGQLERLCALLGVPFTERMLHWPAGPRASDGVWAPYWYEAVWKSTGFEPPRAARTALQGAAAQAAEACRPAYEALRRWAL